MSLRPQTSEKSQLSRSINISPSDEPVPTRPRYTRATSWKDCTHVRKSLETCTRFAWLRATRSFDERGGRSGGGAADEEEAKRTEGSGTVIVRV